MTLSVLIMARGAEGELLRTGVCNYDCSEALDVHAKLKDLSDEILDRSTDEGFTPHSAMEGDLLILSYPQPMEKDLNMLINRMMKVCHWRLYEFHRTENPYHPEE